MTKPALIVSTYNHLSGLESCLLSLERQTVPIAKIYIADDGSTEDTQHLIRSFQNRLPIEHVWQDDVGFRKGRILNLVIAAAVEPYLIFVDGDEVLHRKFVEDHTRAAFPSGVILGTRCGILGWRQRVMKSEPTVFQLCTSLLNGKLINDSRSIEVNLRTRMVGLFKGFRLASPRLRIASYSSTRGGNMAAWREDLLRVNGFDGGYEGWGFEDHDIARRLRQSGADIRQLVGGAICYHLEGDQGKNKALNIKRYQQDSPIICLNGIRELKRSNIGHL